jgi:hypothetical protein
MFQIVRRRGEMYVGLSSFHRRRTNSLPVMKLENRNGYEGEAVTFSWTPIESPNWRRSILVRTRPPSTGTHRQHLVGHGAGRLVWRWVPSAGDLKLDHVARMQLARRALAKTTAAEVPMSVIPPGSRTMMNVLK